MGKATRLVPELPARSLAAGAGADLQGLLMPRKQSQPAWGQTIAILVIVFACAALLLWSGLDQSGVKP